MLRSDGRAPPKGLSPFGQRLAQVREASLVHQVADLLQRYVVIPQGKAFQQGNGFGKRIIAVAAFGGLRLKQAYFFVMLQQVGCYTHLFGVFPDAVMPDPRLVGHADSHLFCRFPDHYSTFMCVFARFCPGK